MAEVTIIYPNQEKEKLRVCAYARVSSDSADQLNSFIAQSNYYTKLIMENDEWEYVDLYADQGITGLRTDTRDEFQRMLADCRKGKIDRILTKGVARFSRNTGDCIKIIRELKLMRITIYFEKEDIDTQNMSSEMMLDIMSAIAQEESISISNNMRWSYQKRMQKGIMIISNPPFGYRNANGVLTPDEHHAKIVKKIYSDYLKGKGANEIAKELTDSKKTWKTATVMRILKNEKYTGNSILQKKYTTDTLPFKLVVNYGEKDKYFIRNSHEAIISEDDYNKVQKLMADRNTNYRGSEKPKYFLTSKIKCINCGKNYKRKKVTDEKIYWVCDTHYNDKDACPNPRIEETAIKNAFLKTYNILHKNYMHILIPMLNDLREAYNKFNKNNKRLGGINLEIAELTEQNLTLNRLRSNEYIDSAIFMEKTSIINTKINKLRTQRRQMLDRDDDMMEKTEELLDMVKNKPMDTFDEYIFECMVGKILVDNNKIKFKLINGLEL